MSYTHHSSEVIELPNYEMASIRSNSWNTDTITGKDTNYTLEVTLTAPKDYCDDLHKYLTKLKYEVIAINKHTLEVTLKTKQAKRRETLTDELSDDVNLFFENGRVLLEA